MSKVDDFLCYFSFIFLFLFFLLTFGVFIHLCIWQGPRFLGILQATQPNPCLFRITCRILPEIFCNPSSGLSSRDPGLLVWLLKHSRVSGQVLWIHPGIHSPAPGEAWCLQLRRLLLSTATRQSKGWDWSPCLWRYFPVLPTRPGAAQEWDFLCAAFISRRQGSLREEEQAQAAFGEKRDRSEKLLTDLQ